jgi:hypothetical protein
MMPLVWRATWIGATDDFARDNFAGHAGAFLDSIPDLPLSGTVAASLASTSAAVGRSAPLRETVTAAAVTA